MSSSLPLVVSFSIAPLLENNCEQQDHAPGRRIRCPKLEVGACVLAEPAGNRLCCVAVVVGRRLLEEEDGMAEAD